MIRNFPDIEASQVLESLLDDATALVSNLKMRRNELDLVNSDGLSKSHQDFYHLIQSKTHVLGKARILRILRINVPAVRGIDANKSKEPDLEKSITWAESVYVNIDNELQRINSDWIMFLTFIAAVASLLASISTIYLLLK